MIIGEKEIKEIVVTNKSNELIISITDNDIISKDNYSVELIQEGNYNTDRKNERWRNFYQKIKKNRMMNQSTYSLI